MLASGKRPPFSADTEEVKGPFFGRFYFAVKEDRVVRFRYD